MTTEHRQSQWVIKSLEGKGYLRVKLDGDGIDWVREPWMATHADWVREAISIVSRYNVTGAVDVVELEREILVHDDDPSKRKAGEQPVDPST